MSDVEKLPYLSLRSRRTLVGISTFVFFRWFWEGALGLCAKSERGITGEIGSSDYLPVSTYSYDFCRLGLDCSITSFLPFSQIRSMLFVRLVIRFRYRRRYEPRKSGASWRVSSFVNVIRCSVWEMGWKEREWNRRE
jgi:hypothetical protein